jgi:Zn-dependent M28 family amino/carboxypeptidase
MLRVLCERAIGASGALVLLAACAGHAIPPSNDVDETGFRDAVRILAADDFEGRKPGTPGEEKTVGYLVAQFRKLGLKPGNGDSFLQPVPLVEVQAGPDASLSVSGRGLPRPLEYAKNMVLWTKREVLEAALQQSELVFVGYGIVAPEYAWNDYANADVHGKTVIVMVNDPGYGSKDPQIFKGGAETRFGRWEYKLQEAARQGAAGVLLIHDSAAVGYPWSAVVNARTGPQLQLATADGNARRAAIEGWVSAEAARGIFTQAGLDFAAVSSAAARPGFQALPLGLKADAMVHNSIRRFTSPNVIAVLPGTERKRDYVIYTAHWDHLGRQSEEAGGGIFHGAVEDATGVAGLLMLAQSFVRTQPPAERSIAFIAFTAAESGLLGSTYYVANPSVSLRQTAGVFNLDRLHVGGPSRDVMIIGNGNSEMEDMLREAALLQGREVHPDPHPEFGGYFESDQLSFANRGVPALYAKAGLDDSARGPAWGQLQIDDYLLHRYYQTTDKYSPDWDVRGTLDDLRLYYEAGYRLARSRRFPRWYPNSDFRGSHSGAPGPGGN